MPDLFPTTGEAEEDKLKDATTTGGPGIVNHLGPDSFQKDGLRPFFEYRPLGLKELTGGKVNPLIGAAGVSAVPMSARVVNKVGQESDPHNFLLMHTLGANVACQI